jgi:hypothetical protein
MTSLSRLLHHLSEFLFGRSEQPQPTLDAPGRDFQSDRVVMRFGADRRPKLRLIVDNTKAVRHG